MRALLPPARPHFAPAHRGLGAPAHRRLGSGAHWPRLGAECGPVRPMARKPRRAGPLALQVRVVPAAPGLLDEGGRRAVGGHVDSRRRAMGHFHRQRRAARPLSHVDGLLCCAATERRPVECFRGGRQLQFTRIARPTSISVLLRSYEATGGTPHSEVIRANPLPYLRHRVRHEAQIVHRGERLVQRLVHLRVHAA